MASIIGHECVLYYNAGTEAVPNWLEIDTVRDVTLNLSANEVDDTSRTTDGWRSRLAGLREWGADFEMIYNTANTAWQKVRAAYFDGTSIEILALDGDITVDDKEGIRGTVFVTSFERSEPLEDVVSNSVTFVGSVDAGCGTPHKSCAFEKGGSEMSGNVLKDKQGTEWRLVLSLRSITRICRKLDVTLAQLTVLEVPLGDLLESIHLMCVNQMDEEGVTIEQFYSRIDNIPFPEIIEALKSAIIAAFPQAAEQMGGDSKSAPFDPGQEKTSSESQPLQESIPSVQS
jgi:predicted secreted protein